jgi:hypothetical protein
MLAPITPPPMTTTDACSGSSMLMSPSAAQNDIAPIARAARPDMAFRNAVTFEVAVAGLRQSSAGLAPTLGNRSNDTEKMKESGQYEGSASLDLTSSRATGRCDTTFERCGNVQLAGCVGGA